MVKCWLNIGLYHLYQLDIGVLKFLLVYSNFWFIQFSILLRFNWYLTNTNATVSRKFGRCYFLMCYVVTINYFGKKIFPVKRKQGVDKCFKPLISSVLTTVASRLKSKQKEKEKSFLKLNTTRFKVINP